MAVQGRDHDDPFSQMLHLEEKPTYEVYRVRLPVNRYSGRGVVLGEVGGGSGG